MQRWAGCIITTSGEPRDDTGTNLPADGCNEFSGPTGFHSVLSAKRELLLFLVVYVFTQHATTGHAPIEVIMPEARRMPLYRFVNDPFRALQERGNVQGTPTIADLLQPKAVTA